MRLRDADVSRSATTSAQLRTAVASSACSRRCLRPSMCGFFVCDASSNGSRAPPCHPNRTQRGIRFRRSWRADLGCVLPDPTRDRHRSRIRRYGISGPVAGTCNEAQSSLAARLSSSQRTACLADLRRHRWPVHLSLHSSGSFSKKCQDVLALQLAA